MNESPSYRVPQEVHFHRVHQNQFHDVLLDCMDHHRIIWPIPSVHLQVLHPYNIKPLNTRGSLRE
jgi:virulence-associated protein VagC